MALQRVGFTKIARRAGEPHLLAASFALPLRCSESFGLSGLRAMAAMHGHACNMHKLHTQFAQCRLSAPRQAIARQCPVQRANTLTVVARRPEAGVGMFGTKAGMTQIFGDKGVAIPATVIALEEGNIVTQVHTTEKRGYNAVQVGYQAVPERKLTKPEAGHCKKAGVQPMRHLREFKVCSTPLLQLMQWAWQSNAIYKDTVCFQYQPAIE